MIEYYSKNTLRFIHAINSEVSKELQNYKSDIIEKYITCDIDYFDMNNVLKEYSIIKIYGDEWKDKLCILDYGYYSSDEYYNVIPLNEIILDTKNIYYIKNRQSFISKILEYKNKKDDIIKFIPSKIIYECIHNQINYIINKITYQQNDDNYWSLNVLNKNI